MQCPSCHKNNEGNPAFCNSCGAPMPVAPPADPLIGRLIAGKVRIVQLIGEGGMGAVYVGEQALGTNIRKVAVKTLHAHLSRDEKVRERFMREAGTLAGLEHPNTVQVFDFGTTDDGVLFMVMEFVQGRSIADELEKTGAMKPDRVEKILTQIAGSLAEAHEKGIIHRDLKPDNIVLTERAGQKDFVKVLDFGIAKRSTAADTNEKKLTQQGMVLGTPPYMSPEQFTGQALDARSDIYSLAVMAYEMLTRQLPFDAKSAFEWATLHMTAAPKPLDVAPDGSLLPESERHAIMQALAKDPAQRFATVTAFVEQFSGRATPSPSDLARQQPTAAGARHATAGMAGAPAPVAAPLPAPAPSPDNLKGKTQIGEPAPFGSSPAFPAGGTAMGAPLAAPMAASAASAVAPPAYGPPPSPAVAPPVVHAHAAPQADRRSGGNKGLIIAVLAIAGLSCVGLIAWGMGAFSGGGSSPTPTVDLGASSGTAPPATTTAPPSTPTDTSSGGGAPPLSNTTIPPLGGGSTSGGVVHPTAPKDAGAKPVPTPVPTPQPTTPPPSPTPHPTTPPPAPTPTPPPPAPTPTPPPPAPTPTPPPPAAEPAICARARDALARNSAAAPQLVAQCRAQGGKI